MLIEKDLLLKENIKSFNILPKNKKINLKQYRRLLIKINKLYIVLINNFKILIKIIEKLEKSIKVILVLKRSKDSKRELNTF